MAEQDPVNRPKAESAGVPGLLDQYRQQRRAWLAQADELVRLRDEVRLAAEREALEIVTAARRDVRRIVVDARRELLVLTAQLHAAVEAVDTNALEPPVAFSPLLGDPNERDRVGAASAANTLGLTRELVLGARREVRSVLDEARAEIEALASEAPAPFKAGQPESPHPHEDARDARTDLQHLGSRPSPPDPLSGLDAHASGAMHEQEQDETEPAHEGPIHELSLDEIDSLDLQGHELPMPTLARLLGNDAGGGKPGTSDDSDRPRVPEAVFTMPLSPVFGEEFSFLTGSRPQAKPEAAGEPAAPGDTPRLTEMQGLMRQPFVSELSETGSFDIALPRAPGAATRERAAMPMETPAPVATPAAAPAFDVQDFTPPVSRMFMSEAEEPRTAARPARAFVAVFAATGALAILGTGWWLLSGNGSESVSAAAPAAIATPAPSPAARSTPGPVPLNDASSALSLTIEARRPSWIRTQVDGKDDTGRMYQAGETRHIIGAQRVSIRAGDAGAVFVAVEGKTAEAMGASGTAVTREFAAGTPRATTAVASAPASVPAAAADNKAAPAVPAPAPAPVQASLRPSTQTVPAPIAASPVRNALTPAPAAAAPASPAPAGDAAPVDRAVAGQPDLLTVGQQWLDAYQRRDRDAMAVSGTETTRIADERSVTERYPAWQNNVRRDLDQVELALTGDSAVLTARMVEREEGSANASAQHVSRISQIWERRGGRWRLSDVRIMSEARLNQIVR